MRFHKEYDLVVNLKLACILGVVYVVLGIWGNRFMANRAPLELTALKFLYNISQTLVCALTAWKLLPFYVLAEHGYGLSIVPNATVEWWVFIYYLCKYFDFMDTVFMVLGKKTRQFTLLHVWHHASIVPLFAYYLDYDLAGGFISALPLLNSMVHVIMYSHYLATSLYSFKNMWWKPIITASQMGHHIVLMVLMSLCGVHGSPEWTPQVAVWGILWGVSIFGLFLKFYIEQYVSGKKKSKSK